MKSTTYVQEVSNLCSQTRSVVRPLVQLPGVKLLSLPVWKDSGAGDMQTHLDATTIGRFAPSAKDSAGDGTVPELSGQAPAAAGAKVVYRLNLDSDDHEGAYRVSQAQQATLHAILSIAKTVAVEI